MKIILLLLVFVPYLSIGQTSKKDKKKIDKYSATICDCVNENMVSLHPKALKVIQLISEKGQEEAMKEVELMIGEMELEEMNEFLSSFNTMESEEFQQKIEQCDDPALLTSEVKEQIDNAEGDAYDYFMKVLSQEDTCKVLKLLHDLGTSKDD